jgi:CRP/FNR family transcriptional regulator, cyclic AMP receptor protein
MRGPYGFEMSESCQTCKMKKAGFFCSFSPKALKDLDSIKSSSAYPEGAILFLENQEARGVFVLCEGEIKLTISSSEGKTMILRIARPGEVLGLMATLSGRPYELSAETLRPCQVAFVRREDFLRFVAQHPEASQGMVAQLASHYHIACEQLKTVGLSASAPEKLARLLLDWSEGAEETKLGIRITLPLTHEEIGEFIGSSRETVTRTLSDFKSKHLLTFKGSTLMIANREALQACANI